VTSYVFILLLLRFGESDFNLTEPMSFRHLSKDIYKMEIHVDLLLKVLTHLLNNTRSNATTNVSEHCHYLIRNLTNNDYLKIEPKKTTTKNNITDKMVEVVQV